jgi:hypothetical protein
VITEVIAMSVIRTLSLILLFSIPILGIFILWASRNQNIDKDRRYKIVRFLLPVLGVLIFAFVVSVIAIEVYNL